MMPGDPADAAFCSISLLIMSGGTGASLQWPDYFH